jgi:HTH-type transcriptional regulator / antitoxin HipB
VIDPRIDRRLPCYDILTSSACHDILTHVERLLSPEKTGDVMADAWAAVRTSEDLGRFLSHVREDRGLTQQALADELGVSRRYVSEIENGKPGLYTERLFQMLRLLGVRLRAEQNGSTEPG